MCLFKKKMKMTSCLQLLTFMGFIHLNRVMGAGEYPKVPQDSIVIELYDGSYFQGILEKVGDVQVPYWMNHAPHNRQFYNVYVDTAVGKPGGLHLISSNLKRTGPRTLHADEEPRHHDPIFADLRLGKHHYLSSGSFEIFDVNHLRTHLEPHIRIYITVPNGPILTAMLEFRRPPTP